MTSAASQRVLVVDDEPVIADSLAAILQARGFNARAVYSAEEATNIADEFQPALLISDVVMPGMSGLDLADWFGDNFPACKVLLISGNANALATSEEFGRRVPAHAILSKPIHPDELLGFIAAFASVSDSLSPFPSHGAPP